MLVSLHQLVISRLGIERRLSPKKHLRVTCKLRSQSRQFTFVRRIRKTRVAPLNPSHFHRRLVQATATTDGRQLLTHVDVHLRANAATNRAALHLVARARRRQRGKRVRTWDAERQRLVAAADQRQLKRI